MRILIAHILLLLAFQRKPYLESVDAFGVTLTYERPDKVTWHTYQRGQDDSLRVGTVSFRSLPVVDRSGRPSQPVVAIIYEMLTDSMSVEDFAKTKQESARTKWTVLRSVAPEQGDYANAMFYDGEYEFGGSLHTIIVGYMVYGTLGVQVIGDSPASVFPQVEDDMRKCVHSLRLSEGR